MIIGLCDGIPVTKSSYALPISLDDLLITGAAAQVACQPEAHFLFRGIGIAFEQLARRDQHAGRPAKGRGEIGNGSEENIGSLRGELPPCARSANHADRKGARSRFEIPDVCRR